METLKNLKNLSWYTRWRIKIYGRVLKEMKIEGKLGNDIHFLIFFKIAVYKRMHLLQKNITLD